MVFDPAPDLMPGDLVTWPRVKTLRGQVRVKRQVEGLVVAVRNAVVTVQVGRRRLRAPVCKVVVLKEVADGFWFPRSGRYCDLHRVIEDMPSPPYGDFYVRTFIAESIRLD